MLSFCLDKKGIWLFSFSFGLTSLPYLFAKVRFVGSCLNICDDRRKVFLELPTVEKLLNIGQILVGSADWKQILKGFCNFLQCYAHNRFDKSSNPGQNREARTHYGPKTARLHVGLSNWAPSYCQETCLRKVEC